MDTNREHLWQAYIDGELSASEAAQFEASLSEAERRLLAADMRFSRAIHERLSVGACPDPVWARTQACLHDATPPAAASGRRWYWGAVSLAAAAAVAFFVSVYGVDLRGLNQDSVIHAASTVEELEKSSEVAAGHDNAARYLKDKGVTVSLLDENVLESALFFHQDIRIVGARQERYGGEDVTEVLFSCCGYPVKVLLAERDSAAAKALGLAAGRNDADIQATRIIDGYLAAVVSKHSAHRMLDIFGDQPH